MPSQNENYALSVSGIETMGSECELLRENLARVEEEIAETMKRLPAHSIKPPLMMELLRLEDERDMLLEKIRDSRC